MILQNPTRCLRLTMNEIEENAFLFCKFTNYCIDLADGWEGFTCKHCRIFELYKEAINTEQYNEFYDLFGEKLGNKKEK